MPKVKIMSSGVQRQEDCLKTTAMNHDRELDERQDPLENMRILRVPLTRYILSSGAIIARVRVAEALKVIAWVWVTQISKDRGLG